MSQDLIAYAVDWERLASEFATAPSAGWLDGRGPEEGLVSAETHVGTEAAQLELTELMLRMAAHDPEGPVRGLFDCLNGYALMPIDDRISGFVADLDSAVLQKAQICVALNPECAAQRRELWRGVDLSRLEPAFAAMWDKAEIEEDEEDDEEAEDPDDDDEDDEWDEDMSLQDVANRILQEAEEVIASEQAASDAKAAGQARSSLRYETVSTADCFFQSFSDFERAVHCWTAALELAADRQWGVVVRLR